MNKKPIVWTIAGSDSGGGAGIQTDLHTFHALGTHGCSVITALTAQNSLAVLRIEFVANTMISAQIQALADDLPARAIKLGMLGSLSVLSAVYKALENFSQPIIYDPVLFATAGDSLHEGDFRQFLVTHLLPRVTLLTPNIPEAEWLVGHPIKSVEEMVQAAEEILALGVPNVLIKGGHAKFQQHLCQDYFASCQHNVWLTNKRQDSPNHHGTGCSLSSAITAALALNYSLLDAIVIAKAYVSQGIRLSEQLGRGPGPIAHHGFPEQQSDYPIITSNAHDLGLSNAFLPCADIGFYPIVDSFAWVKKLLQLGVKTIQLRIKSATATSLREELSRSIHLAREYHAQLFINDHWQLAIALGAYGVHLGQEDLAQADGAQIQKAGLRLGISTHCYYEIARALAFQPSYIAIGPIYPTQTKSMPFSPQGLLQLQQYCRMLTTKTVAIGGITLAKLPAVWQTGVQGVAVISAITHANDPQAEVIKWLEFFNSQCKNKKDDDEGRHY